MWRNSNCDITQIVRRQKKLKNPKCDKTQMATNSRTQILKTLETQIVSKIQVVMKLKLWFNSKAQIVIRLENSKGDETQNTKLWQNAKTQFVPKLKNSNCYKT